MKVVFFEFAINYGGARRSTIDTVAELRSDFDTSIVDAYGCCDEFRDAAHAKGIPFQVADPQPARIVGGFGEGLWSRFWKLACAAPGLLQTQHRAFELFSQMKADVVVSNCTKGMYIISAPGKGPWKTLGYMRGWYTPDMLPPYAKHVLRKRLDRILAVSYATRNALICSGIAHVKISVIPNAVDTDVLNNMAALPTSPSVGFNPHELKILIAADCRPAKGQLTAIEAMHILDRKGIAARLYLAGSLGAIGPSQSLGYLAQLRQRATEYGIQDRVVFLDKRLDIPSLISRVDVVALPSYSEGMPRVVLEAMALGKPVVATPVGGVVDLVLPSVTGFLFEAGASEDMALQLAKLTDPVLRHSIGECARVFVGREFTPERRRARLVAVLRSLSSPVRSSGQNKT